MKNQKKANIDNLNLELLGKLHLSSAFEHTSDSVWAINSAYEILYTNKVFVSAYYQSFGLTVTQGTNIILSLPDPLKEEWKARYDRVLNNESLSFVDNIKAENTILNLEVFMNPIVIDGEVIGVLVLGKDITERKKYERALIDSQLLLKSSLESQRDTILFSINKEYQYLYFNSAHSKTMKHAYGIDIEIGMNILDCITSVEDRVEAKDNYDRALRGETHSNIREYGKENLAYYESFFNPIFNEKNEIIGATGLARDISERKKTELDLIESERELRELNATKDKLFSIIAHDLRSPFHSIITLCNLLLEKVNEASFTDTEKYLSIINSSANNTLILLDNLLNWAKSQTGAIRFNPVSIDFSHIILDVLRLEKTIAKTKDISVNYFMSDDIEVYADENMLKTVLGNLLSNAIKFTKPGGEIGIYAKNLKEHVEITISDNGIGISEDRLDKLFTLSSNSSTVGTASEKGSGLGLLLCKDFIDKHGGKIWVESKDGKGSDFKFKLPKKSIS